MSDLKIILKDPPKKKKKIEKKPPELKDIETRSSKKKTFFKNNDNEIKIENLINDEKKIIFQNPWSKLDNGSKINRVYIFIDEFDKYNLNLEEKDKLKELLKNFILKNKLNKNSDIIYDSDEQKIKEIKILYFDEDTRNFTLKVKKNEIKKKINKSKTNIEKILKKK